MEFLIFDLRLKIRWKGMVSSYAHPNPFASFKSKIANQKSKIEIG
jgi:hypothetical protein